MENKQANSLAANKKLKYVPPRVTRLNPFRATHGGIHGQNENPDHAQNASI